MSIFLERLERRGRAVRFLPQEPVVPVGVGIGAVLDAVLVVFVTLSRATTLAHALLGFQTASIAVSGITWRQQTGWIQPLLEVLVTYKCRWTPQEVVEAVSE